MQSYICAMLFPELKPNVTPDEVYAVILGKKHKGKKYRVLAWSRTITAGIELESEGMVYLGEGYLLKYVANGVEYLIAGNYKFHFWSNAFKPIPQPA